MPHPPAKLGALGVRLSTLGSTWSWSPCRLRESFCRGELRRVLRTIAEALAAYRAGNAARSAGGSWPATAPPVGSSPSPPSPSSSFSVAD